MSKLDGEEITRAALVRGGTYAKRLASLAIMLARANDLQSNRKFEAPVQGVAVRLASAQPSLGGAAQFVAAVALSCMLLAGGARADGMTRQVLAFYYGWYGNPATSGRWMHWEGVDPVERRIGSSTHFPTLGAYDSHDPDVVEQHAAAARAGGLTGFITSWWGRGSFEDEGVPLLLLAARRHRLTVSAYYEEAKGDDAASRKASAIADLDYLLQRYGSDPAWLRVGGNPVVFIYSRAVKALAPAEWQEVLVQVRRDHPRGAVVIADTLKPEVAAVFDGAHDYNITRLTQHKSPSEIGRWAHAAYPQMVAAAGPGKISTATVIPGYDDRGRGRSPPRPVTDRWGGEVYRTLWREAIGASPDWVLITSWNEWHEGSEIEASVEYGAQQLNDTANFVRQFLARRWRSG